MMAHTAHSYLNRLSNQSRLDYNEPHLDAILLYIHGVNRYTHQLSQWIEKSHSMAKASSFLKISVPSVCTQSGLTLTLDPLLVDVRFYPMVH